MYPQQMHLTKTNMPPFLYMGHKDPTLEIIE